jgi:hypothetical protein
MGDRQSGGSHALGDREGQSDRVLTPRRMGRFLAAPKINHSISLKINAAGRSDFIPLGKIPLKRLANRIELGQAMAAGTHGSLGSGSYNETLNNPVLRVLWQEQNPFLAC